jgi:thermitase
VTLALLAVAMVLAAVPAMAGAATPGAPAQMAPRRSSVVVAVSNATQLASVRKALEAAGGTVKSTFRWNALLVSAPVGMDSVQFSAVARKVAGVRYAQGNTTYHALGTANDPLFSQQWGLPDIGAPKAWDSSEGSGVAIAIIDTGIDSTHQDLAANVVLYRNYVTPGASAADDEGHGTHVAGIAGAVRNNSLFGAGTAPKVKLYAFKVLDSSGSGSDSAIASAIRDAVDFTPCRILSMSLGGPAGGSGDVVLQDAITYAQSKGAIVIAAAGNDGSTALSYPAAMPGVIGVGAVDSADVLASFSNRGPSDEDIVAPGVGILSTTRGNASASWSGTSMATPFVSGAAALVWSAHPELSATQVTNLLLSTAQDLGSAGVDSLYGHGLVRPDLAIAAAGVTGDTTPPTTTSNAVGSYVGAASIHLTATDNAGGSGVAHTYYKLDGGTQAEGLTVAATGVGSHSLEFWSVDVAGNVETPHKSTTFEITQGPAITGSSVTIASSSAQVGLPKPFTLTGALSPGTVGDIVVVYVKKPASGRWSYSSARGVYASDGSGGGLWWYRYSPLLRGTYQYYSRFAGDVSRASSVSRTISVVVR